MYHLRVKKEEPPKVHPILEIYGGHCPLCDTSLVYAEASFYCPYCGFSEYDFEMEGELLSEVRKQQREIN